MEKILSKNNFFYLVSSCHRPDYRRDSGFIYGSHCAHPTLAEAIAEVAEGVIGKPIHLARG